MLSSAQIKYLRSLKTQKYRQIYNKFIAEGPKLVIDLLKTRSFEPEGIYLVKNCIDPTSIESLCHKSKISFISESEIKRISMLKQPQGIYAVFHKRYTDIMDIDLTKGYHFLLDGVQDPGNAGTIIRIADWFGVSSVIRTVDSVDFFNPKLVQASMGSLGAVSLVNITKEQYPVLRNLQLVALDLNGTKIHDFKIPENAIFVIGSEGRGVSAEMAKYISQRIFIPGSKSRSAESLNASVAAGILASRLNSVV